MSDVLGNALVKKPESRKFAIYVRHGETHSNKLVGFDDRQSYSFWSLIYSKN